MKSIFLSKTAWVGMIVTLLALFDQVKPFIPAEWLQYCLAASGILTIIMRLLTSQPIKGVARRG